MPLTAWSRGKYVVVNNLTASSIDILGAGRPAVLIATWVDCERHLGFSAGSRINSPLANATVKRIVHNACAVCCGDNKRPVNRAVVRIAAKQ
jgi:hypothetical protein